MPGGRSIQLVRVFGIRIGVDASWFVFLFLVIWLWSDAYRNEFPGHGNRAFALGVAVAFLLFASILLHELGHAVTAMRNGIEIAGIDLFMFGGLARMRKDSPTPWIDFKIAAAGPAVTAVIAALCFLGGVASGIGPGGFVDTMFLNTSSASPGQVLLADVCAINIALLVFNLLPGLPLDGGRIVRAIAWWRTGDRNRATRIMAASGRGLAWVIGAGGAWLALNGALASGIWLVFIAAFIIAPAARAAEASTIVTSRIEGLRVADVMDSEPVAVPAEASVALALDDFFLRYRWEWFPVVDATGHFVGLVERKRVDDAAADAQVGDVVAPETRTVFRVGVDEPLETLLSSEGLQRLGAIMAVDGDGMLRGVVTVEQVARALQPFARTA